MSDESNVETTEAGAEGAEDRPAEATPEARARALCERVKPDCAGLEAARAWLPVALDHQRDAGVPWKYLGLAWTADLAERLANTDDQLAELEAEFDAQAEQLEKLQKENATLKGQNTKLRKRIAELEEAAGAGE